jgi:Domain of unknown function (DUF4382)
MPNKLTAVTALLGCAMLAGCESRTNVSATGSTPAQYTHVFLTINQIWFNTSSTALATDSSWDKFTLTTPETVDLVALNNGTLNQFANQLKLASGTYAQVMLILADSTDALTTSAQTSGAASNDEVDYVDTLDLPHTVPLAILNAAQGISISTSLTVAAASTSSGFGSTTTSTSTTATSSGASTFSAPVASTTSAIIDFDATRDLVPIALNGQPAFALNPHPQTYDVKYSGSIQGAVGLTNVSTLSPAALPDVQVAAEALSSDGTRHVIIKSTLVDAEGNFTLYPLSTASGAPTAYDLVIHGPTIETVIIKSVPVTAGAPGSTTAVLGTLALTSANPFLVNVNSTSPASPTSSVIGFYQTLPLTSEVPYLVEQRALDPTSGVFASDQSISSGGLQYGTYVAGGTIALTNVNPNQGAATYAIAAINPAYGEAALGTTVTSPGTSTPTTALLTVAAPPLPSGSSANSITGTLSIASAGAYDSAELFLTYNGALVAATPLTAYLNGGTLSLTGVAPGGGTAGSYGPGVYNAEVWAWNSSSPTTTLVRTPAATSIDMSAGNATGVTLNIQ